VRGRPGLQPARGHRGSLHHRRGRGVQTVSRYSVLQSLLDCSIHEKVRTIVKSKTNSLKLKYYVGRFFEDEFSVPFAG
jgi:hypothetical protein